MQDIKKYVNTKSFLYVIILLFGYFLGDADLENLVFKKLNYDISVFSKSELLKNEYLVTRVIDGDTVHVKDLNGKEDILRFLAVDTLEKNSTDPREKCLANLQTEFTKENLLNKNIIIETDETQGERDKYGRLLVYVKVTENTPSPSLSKEGNSAISAQTNLKIFNEILLETGNAKVYRANPPAKNISKYLRLEKNAQEKKLGMWNPELCKQF